jgi:predicted nucleotidyltransferase component of viral defense system
LSGLTEFQAEVARLFFSLPASDGFLLAGGSALLASGLTTRPTEDLDFFGERGRANIAEARDQLEAAVVQRGWSFARVQDGETFVRLHLSGDGEVIVDLAIDVAGNRPPVVTIVGPTFDPEELAGRKLAALFSRAEARDFADVYVLAQRFSKELLLERAAEDDLGFDHRVLAEMMRTLDRFTDEELPVGSSNVDAVRAFFRDWAIELEEAST